MDNISGVRRFRRHPGCTDGGSGGKRMTEGEEAGMDASVGDDEEEHRQDNAWDGQC